MTSFRRARRKFFVIALSALVCVVSMPTFSNATDALASSGKIGGGPGPAGTWQSSKRVAEAARTAVLHSLVNGASNGADITVTPPQTSGWIRNCGTPLEAFLLPPGCQMGQCAVAVSCADPKWTLSVTASIIYREPVVEAVNYLPAGAVIGKDELRVRILAVEPGISDLAHRIEDVVGHIPTAGIPAGTPVNLGLLVARKLVHEGTQVVVVARFGAVSAKTTGIAITGGAAGDKVLVRNPDSGRVLTGIVQKDGTVLLN